MSLIAFILLMNQFNLKIYNWMEVSSYEKFHGHENKANVIYLLNH